MCPELSVVKRNLPFIVLYSVITTVIATILYADHTEKAEMRKHSTGFPWYCVDPQASKDMGAEIYGPCRLVQTELVNT